MTTPKAAPRPLDRRAGGGMLAAIHVLKGKLRMRDEDYRALLNHLTGHTSSKDCTPDQQRRVRAHLQKLAEAHGVASPARRADFEARKAEASPRERKVWALWNQLHRDGRIANASGQALNAWVKRQAGVDALRFCTGAQLDALIEALKRWEQR